MFSVDLDRVRAVSRALAGIGWDGFVRLDMLEPEFNVLSEIYHRVGDVRVLLVLGLSAAIVDYQLAGDAFRFWNTLQSVLAKRGFKLSSIGDVKAVMDEFLGYPVNARFNSAKRGRVARFFDSGFARFLWDRGYMYYSDRPREIWYRLAEALGNRPDQKTIAFAMKVLDLISLLVNGSYANFPRNVPIPLDVHVARMALYSGIIKGGGSETSGQVIQRNRGVFLRAWGDVAERVSETLGRRISPLRIDSLVWQLSKEAQKASYRRKHAIRYIIKYLVNAANIDENAAKNVAKELTYNMPC